MTPSLPAPEAASRPAGSEVIAVTASPQGVGRVRPAIWALMGGVVLGCGPTKSASAVDTGVSTPPVEADTDGDAPDTGDTDPPDTGDTDTDTDASDTGDTDTDTDTGSASTTWFDDFTDGIDPAIWYMPRHQWGGDNGGVAPENVSVSEGVVQLHARGNHYTGDIVGYDRSGFRDDGVRTGAAMVTRQPLGPGRYEVSVRLPTELGAASAIWTFHYQEFGAAYDDVVYTDLEEQYGVARDDAFWLFNYCEGPCEIERGYYVANHEIDIELPGRPDPMAGATSGGENDPTYSRMLTNTWRGEGWGEDFGTETVSWACEPGAPCVMPLEYQAVGASVGEAPLTDGEFHTLRFDWHTAGEECVPESVDLEEPTTFVACRRVEFYRDDTLLQVNTGHIPDIPGQLWLGIWFPWAEPGSPRNWAGEPEFDTVVFEVDWVRFTPFDDQPVRAIDLSSGERSRSEALATVAGPGEQVLPNDTHGQVWRTHLAAGADVEDDARIPGSYLLLCEDPSKPGADCSLP